MEERERAVRVFAAHTDAYLWAWMPQMVDEWFTDLRAVRHCAMSTVCDYQVALRGICNYVTDPAYGWSELCEKRFGTAAIRQMLQQAPASVVAGILGYGHAHAETIATVAGRPLQHYAADSARLRPKRCG